MNAHAAGSTSSCSIFSTHSAVASLTYKHTSKEVTSCVPQHDKFVLPLSQKTKARFDLPMTESGDSESNPCHFQPPFTWYTPVFHKWEQVRCSMTKWSNPVDRWSTLWSNDGTRCLSSESKMGTSMGTFIHSLEASILEIVEARRGCSFLCWGLKPSQSYISGSRRIRTALSIGLACPSRLAVLQRTMLNAAIVLAGVSRAESGWSEIDGLFRQPRLQ